MLDTEQHVNRNTYCPRKSKKRITKGKKYIVSYMGERNLVGSKSGTKMVFTYIVTTLYRA